MSENGEIYTDGKNFTLPPAVTAWTNSTSVSIVHALRLAHAIVYALRIARCEAIVPSE